MGTAHAGIKGSLKERGIRLTRQRQILLDLIDRSGKHLDAESLYTLARERDPKLNRVTVYRTLKMLKQGGLEACSLAFYKDGDLGDDGEWDNWRLEGPSFVWYFRGEPHVHIWIHIADDPSVVLNARG